MEINNKTLFLVLLGAYLYLYFTDTFKTQSFQTNFRAFLNATVGNSSSHGLLNWFANKTNTIAGVVSVSSVTILNSLPVSALVANNSLI